MKTITRIAAENLPALESVKKEILVKTALSPSKLPGLGYALNPYRGCEHACVYCYAPSVIHWDKGKWGELVEVKVNLPRVLSKELKVKKKGVVGLSTVTDPYHPAEKKYEITRRCLELLLMHDFPVCIQTKSSLVLRDMDLLKRFSNIEVGVTLTTLNEGVREKLEAGASSVAQRLNALSELSKNGISTWVFIGPVMPYLTEGDALVDAIIAVKPKYVLVDKLRCKEGVRDNVMGFISKFYPQLKEKYIKIFFENEDFYGGFFENIKKKCDKNGLKCEINKLNE
jgi:DNA repair photolyase